MEKETPASTAGPVPEGPAGKSFEILVIVDENGALNVRSPLSGDSTMHILRRAADETMSVVLTQRILQRIAKASAGVRPATPGEMSRLHL